jgi:hypothetical protein
VSIEPIRIVGVAAAVLFVTMAIHAAPLQPSIPRIQFTFSEASFNSILAQWRPDGVSRFTWHFAIDFPFLVSYGIFGYLLARNRSLQAGDFGWPSVLVAWALPVAAVLDAAENALHLSFVLAAAGLPAWLYPLAGGVATAKWVLIVAFAAELIFSRVRNAS